MRVEQGFLVSAPVDRVLAVMRDPSLIEENERARDAVSVRIEELATTGEEHRFVIHTENYARGVRGPDRSRTERNRIDVRWNLRDATCRWRWTGGGAHAEKTRISGFDRLVPGRGGTDVVFSVEIEIGIPLLGRALSRTVAREFRKEWPRYVERISRRLEP